jgi:hypothetical protein
VLNAPHFAALNTPEEFSARLKIEISKWSKVIRDGPYCGGLGHVSIITGRHRQA